MTFNDQAIIYKVSTNGVPNRLGSWKINGSLDMKYSASTISSGRRFFRVGTAKVREYIFCIVLLYVIIIINYTILIN